MTPAFASGTRWRGPRLRTTAWFSGPAALAGIIMILVGGVADGQQPAGAQNPMVGTLAPLYPLAPPPATPPPPVGAGLIVSAESPAPFDPKESAAANFSQRLADVEKFVKGERD